METGCVHFGLCGGCVSIDRPYEESLATKGREAKELIESALREKQQEIPFYEGILKSPAPYEYRNKMEFSFGDSMKDGPLCLGMHRRRSFYDIVTVSDCRLVDEDFRQILRSTRDYFAEIPYYHRKRKSGYLRHLIIRKASFTGQILTDLVTTTASDALPMPEEELLAGYREMLLKLPLKGELKGILHTVNDAAADAVINEGTTLLYGQGHLTEKLLGLSFRITPFSFFQTNSYSAEVLYTKVREYAALAEELTGNSGGFQRIFDLYCGTGTIAQLLAKPGRKITGVEIIEEAVEAAGQNACLNGFSEKECEFIAGDVLKVLDALPAAPQLIVLDPPREGVHPKALPRLLSFGAGALVYVSCKIKSLARDMEAILDAGYVLNRFCAVDQFPHTANTEAVALFLKR